MRSCDEVNRDEYLGPIASSRNANISTVIPSDIDTVRDRLIAIFLGFLLSIYLDKCGFKPS